MSELPFSPFLIAPWLFTVAHAYANEYNMCVYVFLCVCMYVSTDTTKNSNYSSSWFMWYTIVYILWIADVMDNYGRRMLNLQKAVLSDEIPSDLADVELRFLGEIDAFQIWS